MAMPLSQYLHAVSCDDLIWPIRAFYIFAAYAILIVRVVPDFKQRFLDYGARANRAKENIIKDSALPRLIRIQFDPVFDWLAGLTVPHSWFAHFYLCSTACSAYWIYHNNVIHDLLTGSYQTASSSRRSRTAWCMILLQVQGLRRLFECLVLAKPSHSRMWIGHYLIGLAFYLVTNIAVWIELGESSNMRQSKITMLSGFGGVHSPSKNVKLTPLVLTNIVRSAACTLVFVWSSVQQHRVHNYFASLKEYKVPDHPIFVQTNLVCPHYAFEVYIYLSFTIMTAQDTRIINLTMLCATVFVAFNLGVTADLTRQWQMQAFPKQRLAIARRRRMLGSIW